jgi:hypothetical protein
MNITHGIARSQTNNFGKPDPGADDSFVLKCSWLSFRSGPFPAVLRRSARGLGYSRSRAGGRPQARRGLRLNGSPRQCDREDRAKAERLQRGAVSGSFLPGPSPGPSDDKSAHTPRLGLCHGARYEEIPEFEERLLQVKLLAGGRRRSSRVSNHLRVLALLEENIDKPRRPFASTTGPAIKTELQQATLNGPRNFFRSCVPKLRAIANAYPVSETEPRVWLCADSGIPPVAR